MSSGPDRPLLDRRFRDSRAPLRLRLPNPGHPVAGCGCAEAAVHQISDIRPAWQSGTDFRGWLVSVKPDNEVLDYVPAWAVAKILTLAVFMIATLEWWVRRSPLMLAIDLLLLGLWLAIRRLKPADYDPAWPRKLRNDP